MKNLKINRKKLFSLYMREINRISDLLEDKSHFTPEELIGIVADVLEKSPEIIEEKKLRI